MANDKIWTADEIAERVVTEAGEAGGRDEVERIARDGWHSPVTLAELGSNRWDDEEAPLEAAAKEIADDLGLEVHEVTASYEDDDRDTIVVTTQRAARTIPSLFQAAIQAEAQRRLEA